MTNFLSTIFPFKKPSFKNPFKKKLQTPIPQRQDIFNMPELTNAPSQPPITPSIPAGTTSSPFNLSIKLGSQPQPQPKPPTPTPTATSTPPPTPPQTDNQEAQRIVQERLLNQPPQPQIQPQPQTDNQEAQRLEKVIKESSKISPDELSTQGDIDKLIAEATKIQQSGRLGLQATSEQPIPMEFITGQQKSIENRLTNILTGLEAQSEPLERKLARKQAARTSALEASKFALERADKDAEIERTTAQKAKEDAESLRRFGITTAQKDREDKESARRFGIEQAGKAETGFTLSEGQVRYDTKGNVVATNVGSEGLSGGFGGAGYVRGQNPTVDSYVDLINSGQYKPSDVPAKFKTAVTNALVAGGTGNEGAKMELLQDKVANIDSLINHRGMKKSVGPLGIGRWTPFRVDTWSGEVQDFVAGIHQLTAKETLDFLVNLKQQGGTLGALNQSELDILRDSATRINDWEIKDKRGNPIGKWNIGESQFKNELRTIQELTNRALLRARGGASVKSTTDDDYQSYLNAIGQ